MTIEEILEAITDDETMPFIQPEQLSGIVDFVIKNYNPSLPSNLDEAAKRIAYDVCKQLPNGEDKDGIVYYAILAAIAGAEWMAGQGFVYEDKVYPTSYEHEPTEFCLDGGEEIRLLTEAVNNNILKQGDKVIVQIRKK